MAGWTLKVNNYKVGLSKLDAKELKILHPLGRETDGDIYRIPFEFPLQNHKDLLCSNTHTSLDRHGAKRRIQLKLIVSFYTFIAFSFLMSNSNKHLYKQNSFKSKNLL